MANTAAIAATWVDTLSHRSELPFARLLAQHFARAAITRLCDCGCNSFDCHVEGSGLAPLLASVGSVSSFEVAFESGFGEPIDVTVRADERGLLAGVDIHLGLSNHVAMPTNVRLGKLLFTTPSL
jgi:hypothetical protein